MFGCVEQKSTATPPQPPPLPQETSVAITPVREAIPPTPDGVFDISKVEVQPEAKYQFPPRYPLELRKAHISGEVLVLFIVRRDGSVSDVMVVKATDVRFAEAVSAAIEKWTFRPALVSGQPVDCRLMIPLTFSI
jgi:TonB family protein